MDFITGRHISRRDVLRGVGASVALPFLDAMVPAGIRGATAKAAVATDQTRLVAIEMVHGAAGSNQYGASKHLWAPAKVGRDFVQDGPHVLPRRLRVIALGLRNYEKQERDDGENLNGGQGQETGAEPHPMDQKARDDRAEDHAAVLRQVQQRHRVHQKFLRH